MRIHQSQNVKNVFPYVLGVIICLIIWVVFYS